jgi:AAA family ATP:ADP antiporter
VKAFPESMAYSSFLGKFSQVTGAATIGMMVAGHTIFKRFGWGGAAKMTPAVLLGTGVAFFSLVLAPDVWKPVTTLFGTTPLMLAVLVGALQNVITKSTKYALFDPCKEMAFIPLSPEEKTKGKAAIDVIGNPLGKSGGSMIQQVFLDFKNEL